MGILSDLFGTFRALCEGHEEVAELKYKRKCQKESSEQFHKKQWLRLFCNREFEFVSFLSGFSEVNSWQTVPRSLDFHELINITIYFCNEDVLLFQKKGTENKVSVRINPILYDDFCKNYHKYQMEVYNNENQTP